MSRRHPYTQIGIKRKRCVVKGCGARAHATWQICATGRTHQPICEFHDAELNRMVLEWAGFPDVEEKMAKYERKSP